LSAVKDLVVILSVSGEILPISTSRSFLDGEKVTDSGERATAGK
jgi:hypothetical protein